MSRTAKLQSFQQSRLFRTCYPGMYRQIAIQVKLAHLLHFPGHLQVYSGIRTQETWNACINLLNQVQG